NGKALRTINCAAIPATLIESVLFGHEKGAFTGADRRSEGVFEQASGGTVFLDEIGELAPAAQAALLRVLETKRISRVGSSQEIEVDVRIVAATHRDLEAMCQEGKFRLDLLYRLNTMTLVVPPLRERHEEIEPLARQFLAAANRANDCHVKSIQPDALAALQRHSWPGNVRELRNVIERAVVIAHDDVLTVEDLPERIRSAASSPSAVSHLPSATAQPASGSAPPQLAPTVAPPPIDDPSVDFKDKIRQYEKDLILDALRRTEWNQTEAAKLLKMPLRTLVHKIGVFNIRKKYEG
ncbi:MAG: sigma-54-dependent Fis family transcriptional regulator, partial [Deltaproteobacteria bacterium]|nr:sigma-54-dependent Fis family transcriptional regulator [Deltaproteobacteria bacterium]